MIDYNTIDPLHHNLLKGKDMTAAEAHTIEKEYYEMKKTYHMALDMLEEERLKTKDWRDKYNAIAYGKNPNKELRVEIK